MAKAFPLISILFLSLLVLSQSLPLSTRGRWIVDSKTGQRVKLSCVNLVSHAQSMVAQGLDKRPLKDLANEIVSRDYNCVRLTWSVYMFTRYPFETIGDVLDGLDINKVKNGVKKHNPQFLNMTVTSAFKTVVDGLGNAGLMVILDNHISQPRWCCSLHDGNGFFGDRNFKPIEWLRGLAYVARHFSWHPKVVGMSLRNELRGSNNVGVWRKYVKLGSHLIHRINPRLLVVISGLNYDNDLSYLKKKPLGYNLNNKVVLEAHLYSFSGEPESKFVKKPLNIACNQVMDKFEREAGFVVDMKDPYPLFLSEFGYDLRGGNKAQNRFMSCFLARIIGKDIDWAYWAFQGSYMYRQGQQDVDESFGIMDSSWTKDRSPRLQQMLQLAKRINQDPNSKGPMSYIMLHPVSGQCVKLDGKGGIELGDCETPTLWDHTGDGSPMKLWNGQCLKSAGDGKPPVVSAECSGDGSSWTVASKAKLQLSTKSGGENICLEKESDTSIVVKKCICLKDEWNCFDDPQSQWFKLVPTNVA
ncbi:glycosyl hydrolase 5 family protein [Cucumis sativus]|uniref:Glycoside hydrolase family 5 domain-containing protein n=1 Tax=Cucumis sativus TaxID=3659 RepID=A0A0A0KNT6_CUCSA|nr:glycosyl hydrolase 5 family protein [Cucumis sativus]